MPIYTYLVKDPAGKTITGVIEAPNPSSAGDLLRERRYTVISLTEKKAGVLADILKRFRGVSMREKTMFARQLATMISAGVPLADALEILRSQTESERMGEVLAGMLGDIQGGTSLSKSMAKYPDVFTRVMVALVQAGEASGKLDQLLSQLADHMEKERDFQGKTRGALIYPAIIALAMGAVFLVMIFFVVPSLTDLYTEIGVELPLMTRILIGISQLFTGGWIFMLILLGGGGYAFYRYSHSGKGKYQLAELAFRFPVFGKLAKESELARFTRTLGILLGAGVPINQALETVAAAMGNILYRDAILAAGEQVVRGVPLSVPIRADPNFPPLLSQMIAVGEETGKLDEVLLKVAVFFENQAEESVKNLSAALEPLIMIVLGVMVGLLVLSIITPIYNLTTQF